MLKYSLPFSAADPGQSLEQLPQQAGIFALFAADPAAEPYLGKAPNLRRRLARLLTPQPGHPRRLQLAAMVARIEYTPAGSEFESQVALLDASLHAFGERAFEKLRLRPPAFLRMADKNPYPRVYVTNTISLAASASLFGPFPSRPAAERFLKEALDLFLLRRCHEDLHPDPAFPGCVYSEMKMCLAPCFKGCSDERYAEEAAAVRAFLASRGESLRSKLEQERDAASEALEFERAQALHKRLEEVQAVAALASAAVRPLAELNAVILQPSAEPQQVAVFLLEGGRLAGPEFFSTAGMRHPNEQSGSSSLFAHPVALEAIPLSEPGAAAPPVSRDVLEQRWMDAIAALRAQLPARPNAALLGAHLCLFARWHYRPRRMGEVFFAEAGEYPRKAILRGVSRVFRAGQAALPGASEPQPAAQAGPL